jgi:hypothetical protein
VENAKSYRKIKENILLETTDDEIEQTHPRFDIEEKRVVKFTNLNFCKQ